MSYLIKNSTSIRIEPYEKIIEDAIKIAESVMGSSYFSEFDSVVVESGGPSHYGKINSSNPKQIFISVSKIISEFSSDKLEQLLQVAATLIHEAAHAKSNFMGGEGPAVSAEKEFADRLAKKLKEKPDFLNEYKKANIDTQRALTAFAHMCDSLRFLKCADYIDKRSADAISNPLNFAIAVAQLINGSIEEVRPESKESFRGSMRSKIEELLSDSLSERKKNPSASIGAISSLLKNMLGGQNPAEIQMILSEVLRRI